MGAEIIKLSPEQGQALDKRDAAMAEMSETIRQQNAMLAEIRAAILMQSQEIERLNRALSSMRVSRGQESAINAAIRARAADLAAQNGLTGAEKAISAEIRKSVREATGCRAMGDVEAAAFDRVMDMIEGWMQRGALRRIRQERGAKNA